MCGRYTHLFTWKQLHRLMSLTNTLELPARYNVAPTQEAPVVRADAGSRRVDMLRWGLVPFWARDVAIGSRTINARSETAATAPAFRAAFKRRRCLVPASGFYEWQKFEDSARKRPWYITPTDDDLFAFAGLWESWRLPDGGERGTDAEVLTFTILTTAANEAMKDIHDRMPVILAREDFAPWLDPGREDPAGLAALLRPCPSARLRFTRIGTRVNSPRNDDPGCIEPASGDGEGGLFGRT